MKYLAVYGLLSLSKKYPNPNAEEVCKFLESIGQKADLEEAVATIEAIKEEGSFSMIESNMIFPHFKELDSLTRQEERIKKVG